MLVFGVRKQLLFPCSCLSCRCCCLNQDLCLVPSTSFPRERTPLRPRAWFCPLAPSSACHFLSLSYILCPLLSPAFLLPLSLPHPPPYHQRNLLSLPIFGELSYMLLSPGGAEKPQPLSWRRELGFHLSLCAGLGLVGVRPVLPQTSLPDFSNWISLAFCLGF